VTSAAIFPTVSGTAGWKPAAPLGKDYGVTVNVIVLLHTPFWYTCEALVDEPAMTVVTNRATA
jgi:hypothetical protein